MSNIGKIIIFLVFLGLAIIVILALLSSSASTQTGTTIISGTRTGTTSQTPTSTKTSTTATASTSTTTGTGSETLSWRQTASRLVGFGIQPVDGPAHQGHSVSISLDGNTAVCGAPVDNSQIGATWVFGRSGGAWTQRGVKLIGSGAIGAARQGSGVCVSADGNTILLGGEADNGNIGAFWIFIKVGSLWEQQGDKLVATSGVVGQSFQGCAVALSSNGSTALIGASGNNGTQGGAFVFVRSATTWIQQGGLLFGSGAVGAAMQGSSVALSADGNTALIGGPTDNNSWGAAWLFNRSELGQWSPINTKLIGAGIGGLPAQGTAVALSSDGKTALIGGPKDSGNAGATWVFKKSIAGLWTQQGTKLMGNGVEGSEGAHQGHSVSVSGDGTLAWIGGYSDNNFIGASWLFKLTSGIWIQQGSKMVGTGYVYTPPTGVRQGYSVAMSSNGTTAIVGGPGNNREAGAVWFYTP